MGIGKKRMFYYQRISFIAILTSLPNQACSKLCGCVGSFIWNATCCFKSISNHSPLALRCKLYDVHGCSRCPDVAGIR